MQVVLDSNAARESSRFNKCKNSLLLAPVVIVKCSGQLRWSSFQGVYLQMVLYSPFPRCRVADRSKYTQRCTYTTKTNRAGAASDNTNRRKYRRPELHNMTASCLRIYTTSFDCEYIDMEFINATGRKPVLYIAWSGLLRVFIPWTGMATSGMDYWTTEGLSKG